MKNTSIFDKDLNPILEIADKEDLEPLVEYLKDKLSEGLTTNDVYKTFAPDHTKYADLIASEIRDMGGNSFVNLFRGEGPTYREIVCDVAKELKAPFNESRSTSDIEDAILETILQKAFDHMSDADKLEVMKEIGGVSTAGLGGLTTAAFIKIFKAGGFRSYQLTTIIANRIAKMVLGHGLSKATNAALMRLAKVLSGPIGWAITGIWTAVDVAGPAYKVTIPCVIHVAMLRKKLNSISCNSCGAVLPDPSAKFCSECGCKL